MVNRILYMDHNFRIYEQFNEGREFCETIDGVEVVGVSSAQRLDEICRTEMFDLVAIHVDGGGILAAKIVRRNPKFRRVPIIAVSGGFIYDYELSRGGLEKMDMPYDGTMVKNGLTPDEFARKVVEEFRMIENA